MTCRRVLLTFCGFNMNIAAEHHPDKVSDLVFINENNFSHEVVKRCRKVVLPLLRHCCASKCSVSASLIAF